MYDEYEYTVYEQEALIFLEKNAEILKTGKWEFRYSAIRDCDGYCPIVFIAKQKNNKDVCKEAWWSANPEISVSAGWLLAQAADLYEGNINVRNKLLEILNPVHNPKYGVYNE